ncbi:MAG: SOS response-associated peptidase [Alphaproteobacteria bacterium]
MCGRYSLTTPAEAVMALFRLPPGPNLPARYNIAPTQEVPVVRLVEGAHAMAYMRWGLVPPWAEDPRVGARMINARAESVGTRTAYREAYRHRRCLVVADGFFEWQKLPDGRKQAYWITLGDRGPFAFAGLWERWNSLEGEAVETCTIITTDANPLLAPIHGRMPVILDAADYDLWLDVAEGDGAVSGLLKAYDEALMRMTPVSSRVNSVAHDDGECIAAVEVAPVAPSSPVQGRLF